METKIFLPKGILDISDIKISVQENNSRVSDKMFSKFMFPFEKNMDSEIIRILGDYFSFESHNLENKIPCILLFENRLHDAFLYIQTVHDKSITLQIDFGFEELPNNDKKLSELPFEKYSVADIYSFAKTVCEKTWPQTNFNYPRIYTTKYPPNQELWKNFDGYLNDLKADGTEMRRNYIDEAGQIFNVNIIHPCPHNLYILKVGFEDAGLELTGDILTDPILQDKFIYSGTEYFSRLTQRRLGILINVMDYYDTIQHPMGTYPYGFYRSQLMIPKAGRYKLVAFIKLGTYKSFFSKSDVKISLNGSQIYYTSASENVDRNASFEITTTQDNAVLEVVGARSYGVGDQEIFVQLELFSQDIFEEEAGEDNGVITNRNEIDLARAVPDMTFGEYVNFYRNFLNYDIDIVGKKVIMNRIVGQDFSEAIDFKELESPFSPVRNMLNKKSFLLRFPEFERAPKNSMFYDVNGPQLNASAKNDTNIIEIKGYAMPLILPKPGGYNTANVLKDTTDLVALVEYKGLQNGQNNATYSPGCDFPELFTNNWEPWLRQRINGQEYIWKKVVLAELFSKFSIRNLIMAYNNIHIIKSISKEKISTDHYEVEITTETVV